MSGKQVANCLVTGCAGNIGSHIVKELLDRDVRVIGIDNFFTGSSENMAGFCGHRGFSFHEMSITDALAIHALFTESDAFDAVLHLAAITSVPYSMQHPDATMETNHAASLALHSLAEKSGVKAFVFAGSAAEYGRPLARPACEQDAGDPVSPYGTSKYLVSRAIEASGYGCSLRFFNIYGPGAGKPGPYEGVVRLFSEKARQGEPLTILGDGLQVRDFVFLGDALQGLLLAMGMGSGPPLTGIYNVGTGQGTTIRRLADLVLRRTGGRQGVVFAPERPGDIAHSVADVSRLRAAAGWTPSTSLEQGLALAFKKTDGIRV